MKGIFITGTDTGVGKTHFGVHLAEHLHRSRIPVQPRKPVETGCNRIDEQLIPDDASRYYRALQGYVDLRTICPYRFELPASPATAARAANQSLSIKDLVTCCHPADHRDWMLIEGAGGFYSPIAGDGLNADLASA